MDGPPRDSTATDTRPDADGPERPRRVDASADRTDAAPGIETGAADSSAASDFDDPVGDLLPRPGVDSRWWYWIAAIPLYVVAGGAVGLLFAGIALAGFGLGLDAGVVGFGLLFVTVLVLVLAGLVLTIVFPVATYIDARAVAAADTSWTPDPLVWGLAALATVVLSAFTLSFVLALYYLYKRHVAVGTP
jgi:hypothetical protein